MTPISVRHSVAFDVYKDETHHRLDVVVDDKMLTVHRTVSGVNDPKAALMEAMTELRKVTSERKPGCELVLVPAGKVWL